MHVQPFLEALSAQSSAQSSTHSSAHSSQQSVTALTVGLALLQQYLAMRERGPDAAVDEVALASLRAELDTLPLLDREAVALRALADALSHWQAAPPSAFGRRLVYTALLQYGQALFGNASPKLALPVLSRVAVDAELDGDDALSAQARLLCGFVFRTVGDWESSHAAYERAYELAWEVGEFVVALRTRVGLAYNASARGDLPAARRLLDATARRASRLGPEALPYVFLAKANLENAAGRYEEAIALCYRAYRAAGPDEEMRYASLVDLAQLFVDYGAPEVAEHALRAVLRADVDLRHHIQAQLHLLLLAGTQQREGEFHSLVDTLASAPFTVRQRALYHLYVAQGSRAFRQLSQAQDAATRAIELARSASLFQLMFESEEELRRIEALAAEGVPRASVAEPSSALTNAVQRRTAPMSRTATRVARAIRSIPVPAMA